MAIGKLTSTVLDSPDPHRLALFYQGLLGWAIVTDEPTWVTLRPADSSAGLSFQTESAYARPSWPAEAGDQQMMAHLDIEVDDLATAVGAVVEAGGVVADHQPQTDVRVCFDPAGHPFCLWVIE